MSPGALGRVPKLGVGVRVACALAVLLFPDAALATSLGLKPNTSVLNRGALDPSKSQATAPAANRTPVPMPEDFLLDAVRFESHGGTFVMSVPCMAPWSHWTLGSPTRIVIDLGQTRSRLPNAPGLHELLINRGVVKAFRTSQHVNSPLDRRVRLTLELSRVLPYEARRVGQEIQITMPDAGTGDWSAVVQGGAEAVAPSPVLTPPKPSHAEPSATTPETNPEDAEAAAVIRDLGAAGLLAPAPPKPGSEAIDEEPEPSHAPRRDEGKIRDLRAALTSVAGEKNVEPVGGRRENAPRGWESKAPSAPASASQGDVATHETPEPEEDGEHAASSAEPETEQPASSAHDSTSEHHESKPAPPKPKPADAPKPAHAEKHEEPAHAEKHAEPSVAEHPPAPKPSAHDSAPPATDAEAHEAEEHEVAPPETTASGATGVTADLHEKNALRALGEATRRLAKGDPEEARKYLERARKYYPKASATPLASLLLRELWIAEGEDLKADAIQNVAEAPDTSAIPLAAFQRLFALHEARQNWVEVERLLNDWGPYYAEGPWRADVHWMLAQAFLKNGHSAQAREHLEVIPAGDDREPKAVLQLAQLADDAGEEGAALEYYRRLSYLPTSVWQQRGLARTADLEFQAGDPAAALDAYTRLLDSEPPDDEEAWAVYQTANCLFLLHDQGGAKVRYQAVIHQWPKSYWAPFAQERLEAMAWNSNLSQRAARSGRP